MRKPSPIFAFGSMLSSNSMSAQLGIPERVLSRKGIFHTGMQAEPPCYRTQTLPTAPNGDLRRNRETNIVLRPKPSREAPSCNASIVRFVHEGKNGSLFSNTKSKDKRANLHVRISHDDSKTQPVGKATYAGSATSSSLSMLKNGAIAVFLEKDDHTSNGAVVFTFD